MRGSSRGTGQDLRVEERYCKASLWNSLKGEEQNLDELKTNLNVILSMKFD